MQNLLQYKKKLLPYKLFLLTFYYFSLLIYLNAFYDFLSLTFICAAINYSFTTVVKTWLLLDISVHFLESEHKLKNRPTFSETGTMKLTFVSICLKTAKTELGSITADSSTSEWLDSSWKTEFFQFIHKNALDSTFSKWIA